MSSAGCVNIVMQMSIPTTNVCDGFKTPSSNQHKTKHTYGSISVNIGWENSR